MIEYKLEAYLIFKSIGPSHWPNGQRLFHGSSTITSGAGSTQLREDNWLAVEK